MPRLYRWYITSTNSGFRAHGIVTGNPNFEDSTFINTSTLQNIEVENHLVKLQTLNTLYEANIEDWKSSDQEIEDLKGQNPTEWLNNLLKIIESYRQNPIIHNREEPPEDNSIPLTILTVYL